ncbi:MAG: ABC transporter ATP-binding protein [Treponema sp.]|jgi:oligopeptide/dipeptide ABC transporter ATP-binding protein|nr:ABC transporter ATP-binding protein [Treponema sp.]
MKLLTVSSLYKRFNLEAGFFARFGRFVNAVNDISFSIGKNESYGLAGESGCGKTTTARMLVRMYEADSGQIVFHGDKTISVGSLQKKDLRKYREKVRYVFQDPARSLNPRMNVYEVLVSGCRRPLRQKGISEKELRRKAAAILEEVGLQAADLEKRPSEFSGGQRQRISIARALLMEPELLICDEVVSALDVSVQGQILNLLLDIRKKRNISFLFIVHDLKVACYFCDRIGIMYRGELMEEAPAENLYREAMHPYTRLLFSSAAGLEEEFNTEAQSRGEKSEIRKQPNSTKINNPSAQINENILSMSCSFAPRCKQAAEQCFNEHPQLKEIKPGYFLRCFGHAAPNIPPDNP